MACSIYYTTFYGSTKQYADALAERLGTNAVDIAEAPLIDDTTDAPIIVLSPIHGPSHPGVKFIKELDGGIVDKRRIALATVGMTLDDVVVEQDPARELLGARADAVTRFYLPGRLNYSELSGAHRTVMAGLVNVLKLKPRKTANERMLIDSYNTDVDRVDLARLDAIVEWVEGQ